LLPGSTARAPRSERFPEVRDVGIGIPADLARPDGMGLRTMSYRAALIHGKLDNRCHSTRTIPPAVFSTPFDPCEMKNRN
jgi:hypothetical protein